MSRNRFLLVALVCCQSALLFLPWYVDINRQSYVKLGVEMLFYDTFLLYSALNDVFDLFQLIHLVFNLLILANTFFCCILLNGIGNKAAVWIKVCFLISMLALLGIAFATTTCLQTLQIKPPMLLGIVLPFFAIYFRHNSATLI